MHIEEILTQLITALNENTAALQGRVQTSLPLTDPAPAPAADTPKKTKAKKADTPPAEENKAPAGPTIDDCRTVAQNILDNLGGQPADVAAICKQFGGDNIRSVPTDKLADLLAALKAWTKPEDKAAAPKPEEKTEDPAAPTVTLEMVIALATELRDSGHAQDAVVPVNKKHGIAKASQCPPEKLVAVYADLVAAKTKLSDAV